VCSAVSTEPRQYSTGSKEREGHHGEKGEEESEQEEGRSGAQEKENSESVGKEDREEDGKKEGGAEAQVAGKEGTRRGSGAGARTVLAVSDGLGHQRQRRRQLGTLHPRQPFAKVFARRAAAVAAAAVAPSWCCLFGRIASLLSDQ
jgi:hypothetical protein